MKFEIGEAVGDYEIVSVLGSGGMGRVYKVRNTLSNRLEAMKVLLPGTLGSPDAAERFLREIRVQASLDHPNIAALRTASRIDNQIVMIMELVDGTSLQSVLEHGPLSIKTAIEYTVQALSALSYAHSQGVVHRDIKPGNIMIARDGTIKLTDFGIAKAVVDRSLTQAGANQGSIHYMSPEQVQGSANLDARSDLYGLGVTLYEAVTGSRPFQGSTDYAVYSAQLHEEPVPPEKKNPSIPPELNRIILKSLAKSPADRFQTADEFRAELQEVSLSSDRAEASPILADGDSTLREGIFLNYRRDDSRADCGRLYDRLVECFPGKVFRDVGSLQPGIDWQEAIERVLCHSAACVVLIGKNWLHIADPAGKRRLDAPNDPVRQEIVAVLKRRAPILPVLVGDARMPDEESLPVELRPLCRREALELTEQDWDEGFRKLVKALEGWLGQPAVVSSGTTGPGMTFPIQQPRSQATVANAGVVPELTVQTPVRQHKQRNRALVAVCICAIAAILGVWGYPFSRRSVPDQDPGRMETPAPPANPVAPPAGPPDVPLQDVAQPNPPVPPPTVAPTPQSTASVVLPRKTAAAQVQPRQQSVAADSQIRVPITAPQPSANVAAIGVVAAAEDRPVLRELRQRMLLLASRVSAVHGSLDNLERQQNRAGLSLRPDMAAARQSADYLMREAETSLMTGDSTAAKRNLDLAERQVERLESFLGL